MNPASNLILVGPMGAGKTTIGKRLAKHFALRFVDSDQFIEQQTGARVATIFDLEGEAGFRQREQQAIAELCNGHGQLIATGGGAVLNEENRRLMHLHGFVIWLRTSVERQLERLAQDRTRPLLQASNRRHRLEVMAAQRDPLYAVCCDLVFESEQRKVAAAAERLARILAQRWHRETEPAPIPDPTQPPCTT
ncbi:shikimate kinase [Pseudomarimonas arenosa]|uniref:Shikimate kinase n=1 Tax=Pseudomarimonas arenosa TaxID=2774145 RepID=A0AAW3ZII6_9GAMM|nr:shikimate kinase [Pseudomarimonas arenosa]MBD8525593.1 shikimate kinase [Pseudomarimonas arenosa]